MYLYLWHNFKIDFNMSTKTDYAFIALNVISWIIFIGLCFEAGAIIFNAFLSNSAIASLLVYWVVQDLIKELCFLIY